MRAIEFKQTAGVLTGVEALERVRATVLAHATPTARAEHGHTPPALKNGPGQVSVINNGTHNIFAGGRCVAIHRALIEGSVAPFALIKIPLFRPSFFDGRTLG